MLNLKKNGFQNYDIVCLGTDDLFQIRAILDEHRKSSGVGDEKPYVMGEEPKPQSVSGLYECAFITLCFIFMFILFSIFFSSLWSNIWMLAGCSVIFANLFHHFHYFYVFTVQDGCVDFCIAYYLRSKPDRIFGYVSFFSVVDIFITNARTVVDVSV